LKWLICLCSIISECIDSYIQKFAKEEWTQLQFTFERVTTEDDLRQWQMGVKTTYRAYAQDSDIEIVKQDEDAPEDEKRASGLIAQIVSVKLSHYLMKNR